MSAIAATPFGSVVLWFSVLAFVALGVWQLASAIGRKRAKLSAAKSQARDISL
jgi:hypothetical protein